LGASRKQNYYNGYEEDKENSFLSGCFHYL